MLGAALVHPDHSHVLPLAPEPIVKQDGVKNNDCERNAAKRLLKNIRQVHPRMKFIVEDGTVHCYRYHNQAPLNEANFDLEVNFLIYEEISPKGKKKTFSWVTEYQAIFSLPVVELPVFDTS